MNFVDFLKELRGVEPPLNDKYGDWLGYKIKEYNREKGIVKTTLEIRKDHLSPSSAVHGGVISGFLDFTCGCAVFAVIDNHQLCSTVDLHIKYYKPVKEGDEIIAIARIEHKGRSLSSVTADLYVVGQEDQKVAMGSGTFNIYDLKR